MKLVILSDTHGQHADSRLNRELLDIFNQDPDSVLIHCGDVSGRGFIWEIEMFVEWYDSLPFKHKIFIAGNHDFSFEESPDFTNDILKDIGKSIIYLQDSGITIDGVNFWGSPVQPRFYDWAFNRDEDIQNHWDLIPDSTNVLITHGPPHGILDKTKRENKNVGCPMLLNKIKNLSDLRVSAFGHIHEASGIQDDFLDLPGVIFVNGSFLDLSYKPVNSPYIIEI
jgi:Icc-related predicted phosphoesterase